jgi:uncharacterized protein YlxW (UPF0749 family)
MIYYFVDFEGQVISEEEAPKGTFSKDINPEMFISRKAAVREAKRQLKIKIKELQEQLIEYDNELKGRQGSSKETNRTMTKPIVVQP